MHGKCNSEDRKMDADIEYLKQELVDIGKALEDYEKLQEENANLEKLQDIMTDVIVAQGKEALNRILDILEKRLKESYVAKDLMEQNIMSGLGSIFKRSQSLKAKEKMQECHNDWDLIKLIEQERRQNNSKMLSDCDSVTPMLHQWIENEVDKLSSSCRKCISAYFALGDRNPVANFGKCILIDDAFTVMHESDLRDDKEHLVLCVEDYLVVRVLNALDSDEQSHDEHTHDEHTHDEENDEESDEDEELDDDDFEDEDDDMDDTVWHGSTTCDLCNCQIKGELFDGKLRNSIEWAVMCTRCFVLYGEGIGWGRGQKYDQKDDGSFVLVAGGRPEE